VRLANKKMKFIHSNHRHHHALFRFKDNVA
jgi:hypothetical protein